jgi:mannose-1-phosphate guanylyltransferase/phosphomannomutase
MGSILPSLLSELGVESVALNGVSLDADPGSTAAAHRLLSRIVTALDYDLAVHVHPAGEKLVLVDRHGTVIAGQHLLLLIASLYWRTHHAARIAVPVVATAQVDELAARYEGSVQRVKSEHLAMMTAAASGEVNLVVGTRGGLIVPGWQRGADAATALVSILELAAAGGVDVAVAAEECRPGAFVEATVPCPWNRKGNLMRRLMEETASMERQLIDGVRVRIGSRWLWVAPDRHRALFRLQAEADTTESAQGLTAEWNERLNTWLEEADRAVEPVLEGPHPV